MPECFWTINSELKGLNLQHLDGLTNVSQWGKVFQGPVTSQTDTGIVVPLDMTNILISLAHFLGALAGYLISDVVEHMAIDNIVHSSDPGSLCVLCADISSSFCVCVAACD